MKLLILDLDGTIRRPKSGAKFICDPLDQEIIPEAAAAIQKYVDAGWTPAGITNQGGVAVGHKSLDDCIGEQMQTLNLLPPEFCGIYFCPDYEGKLCWQVINGLVRMAIPIDFTHEKNKPYHGFCRKPSPGMIHILLSDLKQQPTEILYVGDRDEDKGAAESANIPFMWASDWWDSAPLKSSADSIESAPKPSTDIDEEDFPW